MSANDKDMIMQQLSKRLSRREQREIVLGDYDQQYLLKESCKYGYYFLARRLLDNNVNPNCTFQEENGRSPLHIATRIGHLHIVELLLNYNANIDIQDEYGVTPLYCAIFKKNLKLVRFLLKRNANKEIETFGPDNVTPLFSAIHRKSIPIIKTLLEFDVDVNHTVDEISPLLMATAKGYKVIKTILESHSNINLLNYSTWKELVQFTIIKCDVKTVQLLLNYENKIYHEVTGSAQKCLTDEKEYLHFLCTSPSPKSHLHSAEIALFFLQEGLNVNYKSRSGYSPLACAIEGNPNNDVLLMVLILYGASLEADFKSKATGETYNKLLEFQAEVNKMKNYKIADSYSVYDILFMNINKLARFVENKILKVIDKKKTGFSKNFPHFNWLLSKKFGKAKERRSLLNQTFFSLKENVKIDLPHLCYEKICEYLDDKDLINLIDAKPPLKCDTIKNKSNFSRKRRHSD